MFERTCRKLSQIGTHCKRMRLQIIIIAVLLSLIAWVTAAKVSISAFRQVVQVMTV